MFNFIASLEHIFEVIVHFIVSLLQMVFWFFKMIPRALIIATDGIMYLPPFLLGYACLFLSVAVVVNVLNKGG